MVGGGFLLVLALILFLLTQAQFGSRVYPLKTGGGSKDVLMVFSNRLASDKGQLSPPDEDSSHEFVKQWLSEQISRITDARVAEMEDRLRPLIEDEIRRRVAAELLRAAPSQSVGREAPLVAPAAAPVTASADEVLARLSMAAEEGESSMRRPVQFNDFRSRNTVHIFGLDENLQLVGLPLEAPRQTQWFWSLTDEASGLSALYFGYYVKTNAEVLRTNPAQLDQKIGAYFDIVRGSGRLSLVKPAVIRIGSSTSLVQKGKVEY